MAISTKNCSLTVSTVANQVNALDLQTASAPLSYSATVSYSTSDITKVWGDSRSVTTSEALDVSTGLTGALGDSVGFATVKEIVIVNTGSTSLTIGGGTNPLFSAVTLPGNSYGAFALATSITTSGSVKNINVTGTGSYSIVLKGV